LESPSDESRQKVVRPGQKRKIRSAGPEKNYFIKSTARARLTSRVILR
jgi:hypothetical protein